ncbi:MAG TPA: FAD-dependent monooxygenase [Burkholderiaceae bacterium]|nr:FAD-dependent monooxygenase [Burkholderiaceae bacterium]
MADDATSTPAQPTPAPAADAALNLAIVGAGPVGLSLALHAARTLPHATVTLFDARSAEFDIARDPRTLALSLGSVQLLERLQAFDTAGAQPILEVHVSQQPPSWGPRGEPELRIRAADEGVAMLGAVLSYGQIVAPLQAAWFKACAREPARLHSRFGTPVAGIKQDGGGRGVEIDAGIAETFDLAVVAEGGVFAEQARKALTHDYRQTAWVGQVTIEGGAAGTAYERFTRQGPAALLPLKAEAGSPTQRAALVWCVASDDDPVAALDAGQRLTVLQSIFPDAVGRIVAVSPLKHFALGLNAERTLVDGRSVRIGNAAQTLHPVAGQGLNLGLRDAFELVRALAASKDIDAVLRRLEWSRAPDRWTMIAATDFLARSFTWDLPGLGVARGFGIAALQALAPLKSALARQMMFGSR